MPLDQQSKPRRQDFLHRYEPPEDYAGIEHSLRTVRDCSVGGVALRDPVSGYRLPDYEIESRQSGAIELRLKDGVQFSIVPLGEYDIPAAVELKFVPENLERYVVSRGEARHSKNKLVAELDDQRRLEDRNGYDRAMIAEIGMFLRDNQRGASIMAQLGMESIRDIARLSVKDSIMLTGYIVASAAKYDHNATKGRYNAADSMSSLDILRKGLGTESYDDVDPLGVCRNYADMTRSVFTSLKRVNDGLRNTNCVSRGGIGSATDGKFVSKSEGTRAHAWNDFFTVLSKREMAVTTVDPTTARINGSGKLVRYDKTALRAGTHIRNITDQLDDSGDRAHQDNVRSVRDFYVRRLVEIREVADKRYGGLKSAPLAVRKGVRSLVVEWVGATYAASGGGSSLPKLPESMGQVLEKVVTDDDVILSPFEFSSVLSFVRSYPEGGEKDKLLTALEKKRTYAINNNFQKRFDASEAALKVSYPYDPVV